MDSCIIHRNSLTTGSDSGRIAVIQDCESGFDWVGVDGSV